ncbi:MAG: hypothetical protein QW038_01680 [Nanopusillaceae archaeon]
MIHPFSFILGFFIGLSIGVVLIYFWIKKYILRMLSNKEMMLKNLLDLLESKRK